LLISIYPHKNLMNQEEILDLIIVAQISKKIKDLVPSFK